MEDEFNKDEISNLTVEESPSYSETENEVSNDLSCVEGNDEEVKVIKSKKKAQDVSQMISKISSGFMVTAVAAVAVIVPTVTTKTTDINVDIKFGDAYVTDTTVECSLYVSDPSASDFTLQLSNNFTKRTVEITEEETNVEFDSLKPNMIYTLEVIMPGSFGSTNTITQMEIKTMSEEDYRTTKINGVNTECRCHIDNYFYFTMDFIDHANAFTNFEAYLIDEYGTKSYCEFTSDLHEEQKILVKGTEIKGNIATLVITCDKIVNEEIEKIDFATIEVSI